MNKKQITRKKLLISFWLWILIIYNFKPLYSQTNQSLTDIFSQSYTLEYTGAYTDAIQLLKSVYDQNSYEINLRLAWLHYSAGLFTEAMSYYQKCIQLMPASIEAKLGYVYPASALGNWDQVVKQYEDIIKIDSKNSTANYRLGLIRYGRKDYKNATTNFEILVNLYPFEYDYIIMYGWCNYFTGKLREAKVLFTKAILIRPGDSSALEGGAMIK